MAEPFCQNSLSSSCLKSGPVNSAPLLPVIFFPQQNQVKWTIISSLILQLCLQSSSIMECEVKPGWVVIPDKHTFSYLWLSCHRDMCRPRKCTRTHTHMHTPGYLLINKLAGLRIFSTTMALSKRFLWPFLQQNRQRKSRNELTKQTQPLMTT